MRNQNILKFTAATLLTFLLTAPLLAQESRQIGQQRERITREINGRTVTVERPAMLELTEANFEQWVDNLRAIMLAQKEIGKMLHVEARMNEVLDPLLQQLPTMKFSDYSQLKTGFVDLSLLKDAVSKQKDTIIQALANNNQRVAQYVPTDPFPGAEYTLNICPLNPQPGEVAYAAGYAVLAASLAKDLAQDVCNQVILGLVTGGNTRLACIITDGIYIGVKIANYVIAFCDNDTLYGQLKGSNKRTEYIKDQLAFSINNDNANKAALSTQISNIENHIVSNGNNNKAALSTQTAAFQVLTIRNAIERNLAVDANTTAAVALFQLPASRGGYLEVARQILIDTYNAQVAAAGAGVTVYNPSSELSLGATFTSQGKYREAYYQYRKAFRSVVKYP